MARNQITRLRASSLTEVVVAMVIIVLVFGIAMTIYTNVLRLSLSIKKMRAQAALEEALSQAIQSGSPENHTEQAEGYRIEQAVQPYGTAPGLIVIQLTAFDDQQQPLAKLQQILIHEQASQ
jgi:type II secretory pathway pseudopilin PulG